MPNETEESADAVVEAAITDESAATSTVADGESSTSLDVGSSHGDISITDASTVVTAQGDGAVAAGDDLAGVATGDGSVAVGGDVTNSAIANGAGAVAVDGDNTGAIVTGGAVDPEPVLTQPVPDADAPAPVSAQPTPIDPVTTEPGVPEDGVPAGGPDVEVGLVEDESLLIDVLRTLLHTPEAVEVYAKDPISFFRDQGIDPRELAAVNLGELLVEVGSAPRDHIEDVRTDAPETISYGNQPVSVEEAIRLVNEEVSVQFPDVDLPDPPTVVDTEQTTTISETTSIETDIVDNSRSFDVDLDGDVHGDIELTDDSDNVSAQGDGAAAAGDDATGVATGAGSVAVGDDVDGSALAAGDGAVAFGGGADRADGDRRDEGHTEAGQVGADDADLDHTEVESGLGRSNPDVFGGGASGSERPDGPSDGHDPTGDDSSEDGDGSTGAEPEFGADRITESMPDLPDVDSIIDDAESESATVEAAVAEVADGPDLDALDDMLD